MGIHRIVTADTSGKEILNGIKGSDGCECDHEFEDASDHAEGSTYLMRKILDVVVGVSAAGLVECHCGGDNDRFTLSSRGNHVPRTSYNVSNQRSLPIYSTRAGTGCPSSIGIHSLR